jgi:hypothetical protein
MHLAPVLGSSSLSSSSSILFCVFEDEDKDKEDRIIQLSTAFAAP